MSGSYVDPNTLEQVLTAIAPAKLKQAKNAIEILKNAKVDEDEKEEALGEVVLPMLGASLTRIIEKTGIDHELTLDEYVHESNCFRDVESRCFFNFLFDSAMNGMQFLLCPFLICLITGRNDSSCYGNFYDWLMINNSELVPGVDYVEITDRPKMVRRYLKEYEEHKKGKFLTLDTARAIQQAVSNDNSVVKIDEKDDFGEFVRGRRYFLFNVSTLKMIGQISST